MTERERMSDVPPEAWAPAQRAVARVGLVGPRSDFVAFEAP